MIRVVALLPGRPDRIPELKNALLQLIPPTRQESGCLQYELHQSTSDPADFCFVEEWESDAALDAHLASPHLQAALPLLSELCAARPDIRRYALIG